MADDIVSQARELYAHDLRADQANRIEALEDLRCRAGDQWPAEVAEERKRAGRPVLRINRIPQFVRQVIGDARLKPPAIKVRPADGRASTDIADIFTGLIRNIEVQSDATSARIKAFESAVVAGIGHYRIVTAYSSDDGWEQDIRVEPIINPLAVVWDAGSQRVTREDARHCFVADLITRKEFERRYPEAAPQSWDSFARDYADWVEGDFVRIAEYWRVEHVPRRLALLASGATFDLTDMDEGMVAELQAVDPIVREREALTRKVTQTLLTGAEQLEETVVWPGRYIPVIPVVGEEVNVGDKVIRHGLVRFMRDAQLLFNIHRSALAETVAMAPKAKWLVTPQQIAGHEHVWAVANTANQAYLPYNPSGGVPQRVAPEIPASSLLQEIGQAAQDLEATSGIYRAGLGAPSNESSGRAIIARQREGDVGTFTYPDNLAAAVAHEGRILIDLIPRIYDTERVVRVVGEDGSEDFKPINVTTLDAEGRAVRLHDLSAGKYDVVSSVGPSYSTRREEARDSMLQFMQAYPPAAGVIGDMVAKAMDWPGSDEIAKRLRRMLPPGLAEPDPEDPPPPPPPPSPEEIKAQAEAQRAQIDVEMKAADIGLERERMAFEREKMAHEREMFAMKWQAEAARLVKETPDGQA